MWSAGGVRLRCEGAGEGEGEGSMGQLGVRGFGFRLPQAPVGWRSSAVVRFTAAAVLAWLPGGAPVGAVPREPVVPILGCGVLAEETGELYVVLGYHNPNAFSVSLPLGVQNYFSPTPIARGQPTVYQPGLHPTVFVTAFSPDLYDHLDWNLDGTELVISLSTSPECVRAVLSLAASGNGTVAADPGPLACSGACSRAYEAPDEVTLLAAPEIGWTFSGWSGDDDCADGVVSFGQSRLRSCVATFEPPVRHALALAASGPGSIVVSGAPVSCPPGPCVVDVDDGSQVTLTAVPEVGSFFASWVGDPDCGDGVLVMDGDRLCVALFEPLPAEIFEDGFEDGEPSAWSASQP